MKTLALALAVMGLAGCASYRPDLCMANQDHLSHPLQGPPFGPQSEEGFIDTTGVTCRWVRGRWQLESGLSYMWPESTLYGDDFMYNGRIGFVLWEKKQ